MLDDTDKKILYELDANCRVPFKRIAEKHGINTSTVFSKIQRMEETGIIEGYSIRGNFQSIGYTTYHLFLEMGWISEETTRSFTLWLQKNQVVSFAVKILGSYRYLMTLKTKNFEELEQFLQNLEAKFERSLVHMEVCPHVSTHFFPRKYLVKKVPLMEAASISNSPNIEHDTLDLKLLNELKKNARMQTLELARKVDCTEKTARERLKKLIKHEVIKRFFTKINMQKVGYSWYIAVYRLYKRDKQKIKELLKLSTEHPHITFLCESRGYWSITLNLHCRNEQECDKALDEVRSLLKEDINKEQICKVLEVLKDEFVIRI